MDARPRVVWMPGRVRTEIHLDGRDTGGAFCMLVDHPPVGWSLPAHLHHGVAETIHVVQGEFELTIAGRRARLIAGQTAHVPPDVIHAGANVGTETGHRILIFSPAGMEDFFLEVGARSEDEQPDPAAVLASATRHGWEFIADPARADRIADPARADRIADPPRGDRIADPARADRIADPARADRSEQHR